MIGQKVMRTENHDGNFRQRELLNSPADFSSALQVS
jgi:hypothetical protein